MKWNKCNLLQEAFIFILLCILIFGCNRNASISNDFETKIDTVYQTKIETILNTKIDTITILQDDTCNLYKMSFNSLLNYYNEAQKIIKIQKDSMDYLHSLNLIVNFPKKVKKNSTITVIQGNDNKSAIDQSKINQKAKDNSAIGEDNNLTKTTKKNNWFWIYIAGFLSAVIANFTFKNIIRNILPNFKPR